MATVFDKMICNSHVKVYMYMYDVEHHFTFLTVFLLQQNIFGGSKSQCISITSSKFIKKGRICPPPKGPGKRGHIVADTLLPTHCCRHKKINVSPLCLPMHATFVANTNFVSGTQKNVTF